MNSVLNIGIAACGGLGDNLNTSALAAAVKKKFPLSRITLRVQRNPEIFRDNIIIDRIEVFDPSIYLQKVEEFKPHFDLFFDRRYAVKPFFNSIHIKEIADYKKEFEERRHSKGYDRMWNSFLNDIPFMDSFGLSAYDIILKSACLDGNLSDMFFSIHHDEHRLRNQYKDFRYITLHNSSFMGRQTKCWPTNYWIVLSKYIKRMGILPIQVGVDADERIAKTEFAKGSLAEIGSLIKGAICHIDTEGGLVHLAKILEKRSIVLFGPTPIHVFGYPENINIRSKTCKACWWRTQDWMIKCKDELKSACMTDLKPELVIKAVNKILKEERGYKVPEDNKPLSSPEKIALAIEEKDIFEKSKGTSSEQYESEALRFRLDETEGYAHPLQIKRVHAVLEMIGTGKTVLDAAGGDGWMADLIRKQGNDVTVLDISKIRLLRAGKLRGLKTCLGRAEKLPFADHSFDVVLMAEVLEHCEKISQPLAEAERVVKEKGKIILTFPVHQVHDAYPEHIKKIRLVPIEDNMVVVSLENIMPHLKAFRKQGRNKI